MKKPFVYAVLNFVAMAAVFALMDLCVAKFDTADFVPLFTKTSHLIITGMFALLTSVCAFIQTRGKAAAA